MDWMILGSRAHHRIIQGCCGEAKAVGKETNTAGSPRVGIRGATGEATKDRTIHVSSARNAIIQGSHGEVKAVGKENNADQSPGLEDPGHTLQRTQDSIIRENKSKDGIISIRYGEGKAEEKCQNPWIAASRSQGEKKPKIDSSRGAWLRTASSRAAIGKQRSPGGRQTPPQTLDGSIYGTRGQANKGQTFQGSRAEHWIIQGCHEDTNAVMKDTIANRRPELDHPGKHGPGLDHLGLQTEARAQGKKTNTARAPGFCHPGERGPGWDPPGLPKRSKYRDQAEQRRPEPWSGVTREHTEERPSMASSRGAGQRTGSSKACMTNVVGIFGSWDCLL